MCLLQETYINALGTTLPPLLLMQDQLQNTDSAKSAFERPYFVPTIEEASPSRWLAEMSCTRVPEVMALVLQICNYQAIRLGKGSKLYDPINLFCEEFKNWLVFQLTTYVSFELLQEAFQKRVMYVQCLQQMKFELIPNVEQSIKNLIVQFTIGHNSGKVSRNLNFLQQEYRSLLRNLVMFLYFVFRDTPETPQNLEGIASLRQAHTPSLRTVMQTVSGQCLSYLLHSQFFIDLFPSQKQDVLYSSVSKEDGEKNPFFTEQGEACMPPISAAEYLSGGLFGTEAKTKWFSTGLLLNFQRDQTLMNEFLAMHGLLYELARLTAQLSELVAALQRHPQLLASYRVRVRIGDVIKVLNAVVEAMLMSFNKLSSAASQLKTSDHSGYSEWKKNEGCAQILAARITTEMDGCLQRASSILRDAVSFTIEEANIPPPQAALQLLVSLERVCPIVNSYLPTQQQVDGISIVRPTKNKEIRDHRSQSRSSNSSNGELKDEESDVRALNYEEEVGLGVTETSKAKLTLEETRQLVLKQAKKYQIQGEHALMQGRAEEALTQFTLSIELNPHNSDVRYQISEAARQKKESVAVVLPKSGINDDDVVKFISREIEMNEIKEAILNGNSIGPTGAKALASSMIGSRLIRLEINENRIGDEGLSALAASLIKQTVLLYLDVSGNRITQIGGQVLATSLAQNTSLTHLNVSNNPLENAGVIHIARALEENAQTKVSELVICSTDISDAAGEALLFMLQKNTCIEQVILSRKEDCLSAQMRLRIASSLKGRKKEGGGGGKEGSSNSNNNDEENENDNNNNIHSARIQSARIAQSQKDKLIRDAQTRVIQSSFLKSGDNLPLLLGLSTSEDIQQLRPHDLMPLKWLCLMKQPQSIFFLQTAEKMLSLIIDFQLSLRGNRGTHSVSQDPVNLFCQEFKIWLTSLSSFGFEKETASFLNKRILYLQDIFKSQPFPFEPSFRHLVVCLEKNLSTLLTICERKSAEIDVGNHIRLLTDDFKHSIFNSLLFLFFVLRDTPNTPDGAVFEVDSFRLRSSSPPDLARAMQTASGQVLQWLVNSGFFLQAFPRFSSSSTSSSPSLTVPPSSPSSASSSASSSSSSSSPSRNSPSSGQRTHSCPSLTSSPSFLNTPSTPLHATTSFSSTLTLNNTPSLTSSSSSSSYSRESTAKNENGFFDEKHEPVWPSSLADRFVHFGKKGHEDHDIGIFGWTSAPCIAHFIRMHGMIYECARMMILVEEALFLLRTTTDFYHAHMQLANVLKVITVLTQAIQRCIEGILEDVNKMQLPFEKAQQMGIANTAGENDLYIQAWRLHSNLAKTISQGLNKAFKSVGRDCMNVTKAIEKFSKRGFPDNVPMSPEISEFIELVEKACSTTCYFVPSDIQPALEMSMRAIGGGGDGGSRSSRPSRIRALTVREKKTLQQSGGVEDDESKLTRAQAQQYHKSGLQYLSHSDIKQAINCFRLAIELDPENETYPTLIANAAKLKARAQKIDKAKKNITDADIQQITEHLRRSPVSDIELGYNNITANGTIQLCRALSQYSSSLVVLGLYNNSIENEGAKALAAVLKEHSCLERVDINQNKITAVGAKAIANALMYNKHLKFLDMGFNNLGDEGVISICSALSMNGETQLVDLRLASTNITDKAGKHLIEMLTNNVSLLKLSLSENEHLSKPVRNEALLKISRHWKLWNRLTPKHREDYPGLINKVVNGKSGAAFSSDGLQLLTQASSLRTEDISSPVVLRLYAHIRLFPLIATKLIEILNEDDRKLVEVYDTCEGLLKLLLEFEQQPAHLAGMYEEQDIKAIVRDWFGTMVTVTEAVKQRMSENIAECLELAVSDRQTLAMTLRLIDQEDTIKLEDSDRFKVLDGLAMIHSRLIRRGLTSLPSVTVCLPMRVWTYSVLEKSITEQFDLVLSPHKKPRPVDKDEGMDLQSFLDGAEAKPKPSLLSTQSFSESALIDPIDGGSSLVISSVLKDMKLLVENLHVVENDAASCFSQDYDLFGFYLTRYHQRLILIINEITLPESTSADDILHCISWISWYEQALKPFQHANLSDMLLQLERLTELLLDRFWPPQQQKILGWMNVILNNEAKGEPPHQDPSGYYFTPAPQDLFSNIHGLLTLVREQFKIERRPLARIGVSLAKELEGFAKRLIIMFSHSIPTHTPTPKKGGRAPPPPPSSSSSSSSASSSHRGPPPPPPLSSSASFLSLTPSKDKSSASSSSSKKNTHHVDEKIPDLIHSLPSALLKTLLMAQVNNCQHYEDQTDEMSESLSTQLQDHGAELVEDACGETAACFVDFASECTNFLVLELIKPVSGMFSKLFVVKDAVDVGEILDKLDFPKGIARPAYYKLAVLRMLRIVVMEYSKAFLTQKISMVLEGEGAKTVESMSPMFNKVDNDLKTIVTTFQGVVREADAKQVASIAESIELLTTVLKADDSFMSAYFERIALGWCFVEGNQAHMEALNPIVVLTRVLSMREDISDARREEIVEDFKKSLVPAARDLFLQQRDAAEVYLHSTDKKCVVS